MLNVLHFIYLCSFTNFIHCDCKYRVTRFGRRDNFSLPMCVCVCVYWYIAWKLEHLHCLFVSCLHFDTEVALLFIAVYLFSLVFFFCRNSRLWSCSRYVRTTALFLLLQTCLAWWTNCTVYWIQESFTAYYTHIQMQSSFKIQIIKISMQN